MVSYQPCMHGLVSTMAAVMQDSLLRSLLKGVVWRVFSTAMTVSIILAVFRDTVQVSHKLANSFASIAFLCTACSCKLYNRQPHRLQSFKNVNPKDALLCKAWPFVGFANCAGCIV